MSPARRKRRRQKRKTKGEVIGRGSKPAASAVAKAESRLRERIQNFAFQERFRDDFESALARFFGEEVIRTRRLVIDEEELPEFQEWFFFDHVTGSGETIIDIFAREEGPKLPEEERKLLDLWRHWNRYRLFEVQKVMRGIGVVVTDLLSDETLEVHDRSASRGLKRWTIFLARPIYTNRLHFTGVGTLLPPFKKESVLEYSRQLLADFQAQHPQATLDEFYRQHGLDIRHFMRKKAAEPPLIITPEGHEVEICVAHYRVVDAEAVAQRLDEAEEFEVAGPSHDHAGALHVNWLQRGRSHVPKQPKPEREALIFETQLVYDKDSPKYHTLGDITLWPHRLELHCISRARLEAGKKLLETILKGLIHHRRDKTQPLEEFMARMPSTPPPPVSTPPDVVEPLAREMLYEQMRNWVDEPIEALGGKTPREAVKDPAGRAQVIEMLKAIEYTEERRREAGEPWVDVDEIRRDLGLPIP